MEDLPKESDYNIMNKFLNLEEQDYQLAMKYYDQILNKKTPSVNYNF